MTPTALPSPAARSHPRALLLVASLVLTGCAGIDTARFPAGSGRATVEAALGAPTGRWHDGAGGQVLEYATGPMGKTTHLLRFGPDGLLTGLEQVLNEARFATIAPGMTAQAVRERIGRPSVVWQAGWQQRQTVWSYRHESVFCQWFMVGLGPDDVVQDTAYGPDPLCEVHNAGGDFP